MDYGFKPTTNGRELLAACAATGKGLDISRVAVGSGTVPEGVDLADVHALYQYVADGTVGQRTHEDDRLYLTVQYSNADPVEHRALPSFILAEFMVYAIHPETGEETDLIYGTLGSYLQPVPAYNAAFPASVFSFPMTIIVSDEIEVTVSATAGLITYDDLDEAVKDATKDTGGIVKTIEFSLEPTDWQDSGEGGSYPIIADIVHEDIAAKHVPDVVLDEESQDSAVTFGMCASARSYTGYVRLRAKQLPTVAISGVLYLIGKATGSGGGGGDYELPTATATRLGGVKIGSGLTYKTDGTTSVDGSAVAEDITDDVKDAILDEAVATDTETDEMIDDVFGDGASGE